MIIDADGKYLGLLYQDQLSACNSSTSIASLDFNQSLVFDETTSLWSAMQTMRNYIGEAVPVVDSVSGRYPGSVPESEVIGSYLDAVHDLRREEHEA